MLEKITDTLSNAYDSWKKRALALGAASLLLLPACASFKSIFVPSKETCPPQIAPAEPGVSHVTPSEPSAGPSPEPPETPPKKSGYGTAGYEDNIYSTLFSIIEKNGIDFFADKLIADLKEVGEHGGSIILTEEGLSVSEGTDKSVIVRYLEPIKRVRLDKDTEEDIELIAEFIENYRHASEHSVISVIRDRLPKASAAEKRTIADMIEQYLDAFGRIENVNEAQVIYHFHPMPDRLSEKDLESASSTSTLPVAFSYHAGKLVAFYYAGGHHRKREFEIKDASRMFELDLLASKIYLKTPGNIFYHDKGRIDALRLDNAGDGLITLLLAVRGAGNIPENRKKVVDVIDFAYKTLNQRMDYLNSVRNEFEGYHEFSETEKYHGFLISRLDMIVDKFGYRDELKKYMPKPEQEMPSAERPLGWKDYLGLASLGLAACAGFYFAAAGARGLMRRFFGSNKTNDAGQGQ